MRESEEPVGMIRILMVLILLSGQSLLAKTGIRSSQFYPLKRPHSSPVFTMKREELSDPEKIESRIYDSSGKEVITERVFLEKGLFRRYELTNRQLGTEGWIERSSGSLTFEYGPMGSQPTQKKEKDVSNFVVSATTVPYLLENWDSLKEGKKVLARYGILDRLESIEFAFQKDREEIFEGQEVLVIRMRPSNFFYATLVNPLYFYFQKESRRLLRLEGRVLPKESLPNGKWKDFEALQIFQYEI